MIIIMVVIAVSSIAEYIKYFALVIVYLKSPGPDGQFIDQTSQQNQDCELSYIKNNSGFNFQSYLSGFLTVKSQNAQQNATRAKCYVD